MRQMRRQEDKNQVPDSNCKGCWPRATVLDFFFHRKIKKKNHTPFLKSHFLLRPLCSHTTLVPYHLCIQCCQPQNTELTSIHMGGQTHVQTSWLATFIEGSSDHLTDGTIQLPISLTWHEVHSMCINAHPASTPILTYSSLLKHIDSVFSHVKLPKRTLALASSACIQFAQQRL